MAVAYVKPTVYPDGAKEVENMNGGQGVERAALFHLHKWKDAEVWEYQDDGWKAPVFVWTRRTEEETAAESKTKGLPPGAFLRFEGRKAEL